MSENAKNLVFELTLTGELSLDFINTVDWRTSEQPKELLNSYSDFVRWALHTTLLNEEEAQICYEEITQYPHEANDLLTRAINFRETLFRILSAIAHQQQPDRTDIVYLNRELNDAFSHLFIELCGNSVQWKWKTGDKFSERLIWQVARSAGDFLTSERIKDLRECPGTGCAWLFIDISRNKKRRWCAMDICGNRAKVRRHYEQSKTKK